MNELQPTFSVNELNTYVNLLLGSDGNLKNIAVRGEISGFKRHPSGHLYFLLKDEKASVRVVMFKFYAGRLSFFPKDGLSVTVTGHVGLFEKDGSFQLYAETMSCSGSGELFRKFIALKEELSAAGWFDNSIKKEIPFLPKRVGVVTSSSGAAIEDIKKVIHRRFPGLPILLYPAAVQGEGAAAEIAAAIKKADEEKQVDVLIVGRGGGSMEDLWAFNEIPVAKAIHECDIPVISAVGHEIDFSICDFVSDVRAATPSAAAEIAVPEFQKIYSDLLTLGDRLSKCIGSGISQKKVALKASVNSSIFRNGKLILEKPAQKLELTWNELCERAKTIIRENSFRLNIAYEKLKANSAEQTLAKGFILASDENGNTVCSAKNLQKDEKITLRYYDGIALVTVDNVHISDMR